MSTSTLSGRQKRRQKKETIIDVPYDPNPKQELMHASDAEELLYGGAKGGGKSRALVMDALAYALEYPNANIYLFRETYPNLEANVIREWMKAVPKELYTYNESKHTARLPNGSRVLFRYVRNERDAEGYQGQEMDYIGVDEATKHKKRTLQLLMSCMRSAKGYPVRFRGTCNPGGKGHGHVKTDYVLATEYGKKVYIDPVTGNRRVFIPASVYDNYVLMKNDPAYVKRLENLPEQERKAFLYGDWDVFIGQVFSEWRREVHVIDPFAIPHDWPRYRAMDWGFAKPYSIHWYAIDYEGVVYCYRELYGIKNNEPDTGTQEEPLAVARRVKELEKGERISSSIADPACWQVDKRMYSGISVADTFAKEGIYWIQGDNSRLSGKMQVHHYLRGEAPDKPGIKFFSSCKNIIRTLPELCYDENKPEDVDTDMEDHAYDEMRYFLMSRPYKPQKKDTELKYKARYKEKPKPSSWAV